MRKIALAFLTVLALASAALGQNPPNLPAGNHVWGRISPVAGPSNAVDLAQVQAVILYGETPVNDANYPMVAADRNIVYTAITATRTVTLLPASTFPAGFRIFLMDRSGNAAVGKNITVAPTGADTINNVNGSTPAVTAPFGGSTIESDGQSKWTIIATAPTGAGSGTVTSVATGTGLTGGPITSTGTISIANTITAGGPTGSGTLTPVITFNAQGQLTAVTTATTAPPFSAVTGQASLAQLPTLGANTVLGSIAGGTPAALTTTQLTTLCNTFTASLPGCVPGSGGGSSNFLRSDGSWTTPAGGGTVTNVALSLPGIFTVTGSPVTTTGTLTGSLNTQTANTVWAGPTSGGVVAPTFRALVVADLPSIANNTVLGNISGGSAAPNALSATQLTTLCNSFTSLLAGCVPASGGGSSNFLRSDGTWTTPAGGGTVTSVGTGTGLTGGPVTTTGSISLASISAGQFLANTSGSTGAPTGTAMTPINVEWFGVLPGNTASTNTTNFAALLAANPKAAFWFPGIGYAFNTTGFVLTESQSITCASRSNISVNGNLVQTVNTNKLFLIRGADVTISNCSLVTSGTPGAGNVGVSIGDDAVKVTTSNVFTASNATITCTSCTFTSGDVGKQFTAIGAGVSSGNLLTSISAFVDATHVTLALAPGTSISNTTVGYGFDYQRDYLINNNIYNWTSGVNIVSGSSYRLTGNFLTCSDCITVQNIVWADQGAGSIDHNVITTNLAGAHANISQFSGGALRIDHNEMTGQAAVTAGIQVQWNGQVSSVGPFITGNSIEGNFTAILINGGATQVVVSGIIANNETLCATGTTCISLNPTNAHPGWNVTNNVVQQVGGGNGIVVGNMSNITVDGNIGRNTDGNGGGQMVALTTAPTGYVHVSPTDISSAYSGSAAGMIIDNPVGVAFASLPTAAKVGSRIYCTDCTTAATCAGSGTGTFANRINTGTPKWACSP